MARILAADAAFFDDLRRRAQWSRVMNEQREEIEALAGETLPQERSLPTVLAPIETAIAIRGGDEGTTAAPIELLDSTASGERAADEDQAE